MNNVYQQSQRQQNVLLIPPAVTAAARAKQPAGNGRPPRTAYHFFFRDQREQMKRDLDHGGTIATDLRLSLQRALQHCPPQQRGMAKFHAVASTIAARWKVVGLVQREHYERLAAAAATASGAPLIGNKTKYSSSAPIIHLDEDDGDKGAGKNQVDASSLAAPATHADDMAYAATWNSSSASSIADASSSSKSPPPLLSPLSPLDASYLVLQSLSPTSQQQEQPQEESGTLHNAFPISATATTKGFVSSPPVLTGDRNSVLNDAMPFLSPR